MKTPKYILKRIHRSRDSKVFQTSCLKCHFLRNPGCCVCKMGEYYIVNPEFKTVSQRIRDLNVLMTPMHHEGKTYVPVCIEDVNDLLKLFEEEDDGHT